MLGFGLYDFEGYFFFHFLFFFSIFFPMAFTPFLLNYTIRHFAMSMTYAKLRDTLVLQENTWSEGWKHFFITGEIL